MAIIDKGLGLKLITLGDLLGEEPSLLALDGATAAVSEVKFWVILDCGEPGARFKPPAYPGCASRSAAGQPLHPCRRSRWPGNLRCRTRRERRGSSGHLLQLERRV